MTIASLAMYPFPTLRPAYDRFWQGVRARLSFAAPDLDWDLSAAEACSRQDLLLGQTCGWPLVTSLAGAGSVDFPIPITIVPGHLKDEDLDAVA